MSCRFAIRAVLLLASAWPIAASPKEDPQQKVIVERVIRGSEGDVAGLREGDIIGDWVRGDGHGEIQSPFALTAIEIEQAPRGVVTLQGSRQAATQVWKLGSHRWGLEARPEMPEFLLSLYRQGQESAKEGQLTDAAERWVRAANEAAKSESTWMASWFLYKTAKLFADANQWKEADAAYRASIQQATEAGPLIVIQLLRAWALIYEQRADWADAEKYNRQALSESQRAAPDTLLTAWCLAGLGNMFRVRGDLANAEEYLGQSLAIRRKQAPRSLAVAALLHNLGLVAEDRGKPDRAEQYFLEALNIRQEKAPDGLDVAATLTGLGSLEDDRGDLDKSEEYLLRGLAIKERLAPDSLDAAFSYSALGNVTFERGDLPKAESYFNKALEIRKKLSPEDPEIAANLGNLGSVKWAQGDFAAAETYYREALVIEQKVAPNSLDTANTLDNLGNVALSRRDLVTARKYHYQALRIRQKVAPVSLDMGRGFDNLGNLAEEEGNLVRAASYYQRALTLQEKLAPNSLIVAVSLSNLGGIAEKRGDWNTADRYYSRALAIEQNLAPNSLDAAETLRRQGDIARNRSNLLLAEKLYRQALTIQERLAPDSSQYAQSLAALGSLMRLKDRLDEATNLFAQSLRAVESQITRLGGTEDIRSDFRARYAHYNSEYVDLLMRQKRPELAFQVCESWRARSLLETLAAAKVDIHSGADSRLLERERSLQQALRAKSDQRVSLLTGKHADQQIASVEKEIQALRTEYAQAEEKIRAGSPVYAALTQPQPLTVPQVQQLLDNETVLLEYSLGDEHSYLWVVTPATFSARVLPARTVIETTARRLYRVVSRLKDQAAENGEAGKQRHPNLQWAAATLSRVLLGPVAGQLQGKRLLIVADGALQYIPFALLPNPGQASPLILEHEIVYSPSASVLAELRREAGAHKPASKAVAVLADPVFDKEDPRVGSKLHLSNQQLPGGEMASLSAQHVTRSAADVGLSHLPRLAFSHREADAIMAVTPPGAGMEALGFEASRSTAMSHDLAQYRIVHFATHGLWNNKRPEFSGLVLSLVDRQGKPQNGFLDLQDIYNLNLAADLVVLSACETALGKEVQGEGLIGVTRGFMYAGATRVVASLWNVNDVSTKGLMEKLYRAMEQEGMRPAAALRTAQIAMWKQQRWKDPYYWAAFQIQGEWK